MYSSTSGPKKAKIAERMMKLFIFASLVFLSSCSLMPINKEKAQKLGVYLDRTSSEQCLVLVKNIYDENMSLEPTGTDYRLELGGQYLGVLEPKHHARFFVDGGSELELVAIKKTVLPFFLGGAKDARPLQCKSGETLGIWLRTECRNCLTFPRGRSFQGDYGPYLQHLTIDKLEVNEALQLKLVLN